MNSIIFESVSKIFRHRPALFNWIGKENATQTKALANVSFEIRAGSVFALLGPNGSGKTTLLKLISTMLLPDAGRVLVAGSDTQRNSQAVCKQVGFAVAVDRSFFPRLTARENLDFFAAMEDVPRKSRSARIRHVLGCSALLDAADTLVMKFSSGMYQRLGIARALLKQPAVLLLDEPTRSLDLHGTADIWKLIRNLPDAGTTVVLATHNFAEAAAVADYMVMLRAGEVVGVHRACHEDPLELQSLYQDSLAQGDQRGHAVESCA